MFQTHVPETSVAPGSDKKTAAKPLMFFFDHVFNENNNNTYVYEQVGRRIVANAMTGYHGCIFAYGQTSSGKTYTIHGTKDDPGLPLYLTSC